MSRDHYKQDRLGSESFEIDISDSTTISDPVDLLGVVPVGLITPAALTGTSLTLKGSSDGITYYDVYNASGTQVTIQIGASRYIGLLPQDFAGFRYFKVVSNSAEAADRAFELILRGM